MNSNAKTPEEYIAQFSEERKEPFTKLRNVILENLPESFEEQMSYGMLGYVLPKSVYPEGYHCNPELPLPFMNIASQKNFIGFYHMGLYAENELLDWFAEEYLKHVKTKLDMSKSYVRFKKMEQIPYELIAELVKKDDC